MMKILQFRNNTKEYSKYIFPKDESIDSSEGIEVISDLKKKEFFVRKVNLLGLENDEDWVLYNDNTFPSSLFREFLNLV